MMISDNGGFEGSNKRLELGTNLGATVQYSYEHYSIPDNFIIRYDGKNLLETGFVGGSSSGSVRVPAGTSDFVQVIVATNDSGTAWNYTASAMGCLAPEPYIVKALSGDFQVESDGTCSATGSFTIGHRNGIASMLRVENGNVSFDSETISVSGTVFSQIGVGDILAKPIFVGSFDLSSNSPVASSFVDTDAPNGFEMAGVDTKFTGLTLNPSNLVLGTLATAPTGFGLDNLSLSHQDGLIVRSNSVDLAASVRFSTPDLPGIDLFGFVKATFEDISLEYNATENAIYVRGKVKMDIKSKSPIKQLTADFAGDNYIALREGKFDVVGKLEAVVDLSFPPSGWGLSELSLDIDTVNRDISGTAKLILPFRGKISAEGTVGFKTPLNPLQLNSLALTVDNLNVPIPSYPLVFFQSFDVGISNFAESDTDPIELMGGVGLTLGPQVLLFGEQFSLLRGDLDVVGDSTQFAGTGKLVVGGSRIGGDQLASLTGSSTLNWEKKFFQNKGSLNVFDGFVTAQSSFKASSSFDVSFGGGGAISVPKSIPFIGGYELLSGNYVFDFSNNGNSSDDFVAGWGTINVKKLGFEASLVVGARLNFDGTFERIGARNIPPIGSFDIPANMPWFTMGANWETTDASVDLVVIRPDGTRLSESEFEANGVFIVDELDLPNSKTVIVFDPTPGIWDLEVADPSGLGDVIYSASAEAKAPTIQVDSSAATGQQLTVNYSAYDPDSDASVQFFLDDDQADFDGIPIGTPVTETDGTGRAEIAVGGIAPGAYYVYARIQDGANPPVYAYAGQAIHLADSADLAVTLAADPSFVVNSSSTLSVKVENLGTVDSIDSVGVLTLPAGVTFESADINSRVLGNGDVEFDLGSIPSGSVVEFEVTFTADSSLTTVPVSFQASSSTLDFNAVNDADFLLLSATQPAVLPIDLQVETISLPLSAQVGEQLTYTTRVTNIGADTTSEFRLSEFVPDNARIVQVETTKGTVSMTDKQAILTVSELNPAGFVDLMITIVVESAGPLVNVSSVTGGGDDFNLLNNSVIGISEAIAIAPAEADLSITVTASATNINVNESVNVRVVLRNDGPGVSSGVQVAVNIPSGLTVETSDPGQGVFDETTGIWEVGNVRDDLSRSLDLVLRGQQSLTGTVTAEVIAVGETDPDSTPGNASTQPSEDDTGSIAIQVGSASRIYVPSLVARPHVIPGDSIATAILFRALADTTVVVAPIGTTSITETIRILDSDALQVSSFIRGVTTTEVHAGNLYAIIFEPQTTDRLYIVGSSAGYAALGNSPTNVLNVTDTNADGVTTAADALVVINQLALNQAFGEGEQFGSNHGFTDVNGDGRTTAGDALMIINQLNRDSVNHLTWPNGESFAVLQPPSHVVAQRSPVYVDDFSISDETISKLVQDATSQLEPSQAIESTLLDIAGVLDQEVPDEETRDLALAELVFGWNDIGR